MPQVTKFPLRRRIILLGNVIHVQDDCTNFEENTETQNHGHLDECYKENKHLIMPDAMESLMLEALN